MSFAGTAGTGRRAVLHFITRILRDTPSAVNSHNLEQVLLVEPQNLRVFLNPALNKDGRTSWCVPELKPFSGRHVAQAEHSAGRPVEEVARGFNLPRWFVAIA